MHLKIRFTLLPALVYDLECLPNILPIWIHDSLQVQHDIKRGIVDKRTQQLIILTIARTDM